MHINIYIKKKVLYTILQPDAYVILYTVPLPSLEYYTMRASRSVPGRIQKFNKSQLSDSAKTMEWK